MKKIIVLSLAIGVLVTNSFILKELATDDNLSSKDIQHEQVAKAPEKYSTNMHLVYRIRTFINPNGSFEIPGKEKTGLGRVS